MEVAVAELKEGIATFNLNDSAATCNSPALCRSYQDQDSTSASESDTSDTFNPELVISEQSSGESVGALDEAGTSPTSHQGKGEEKPQICFDFTKGLCTRGDKCKFSHDLATIVQFNSKEKGICFDYLKNQCSRGLLCRFSHDLSNIAQQCQALNNTQGARGRSAAICYDFVKGVCSRGAECRYSHDLSLIARTARGGASGPGGEVCYDYLRGRCNRGSSCKYSHNITFMGQPGFLSSANGSNGGAPFLSPGHPQFSGRPSLDMTSSPFPGRPSLDLPSSQFPGRPSLDLISNSSFHSRPSIDLTGQFSGRPSLDLAAASAFTSHHSIDGSQYAGRASLDIASGVSFSGRHSLDLPYPGRGSLDIGGVAAQFASARPSLDMSASGKFKSSRPSLDYSQFQGNRGSIDLPANSCGPAIGPGLLPHLAGANGSGGPLDMSALAGAMGADPLSLLVSQLAQNQVLLGAGLGGMGVPPTMSTDIRSQAMRSLMAQSMLAHAQGGGVGLMQPGFPDTPDAAVSQMFGQNVHSLARPFPNVPASPAGPPLSPTPEQISMLMASMASDQNGVTAPSTNQLADTIAGLRAAEAAHTAAAQQAAAQQAVHAAAAQKAAAAVAQAAQAVAQAQAVAAAQVTMGGMMEMQVSSPQPIPIPGARERVAGFMPQVASSTGPASNAEVADGVNVAFSPELMPLLKEIWNK